MFCGVRTHSRSAHQLLTVVLILLALAFVAGPAHATTLKTAASCASAADSGACLAARVSPNVGDCERANVTCRPPLTGSCTGFSSQTTPPATIKVFVPSATPQIQTVDFRTYIKNVLPNEWTATWNGESLKAGAIAVKSYAWYWTTHFGGYLDDNPDTCFDVTDDQDFQVYQANSENSRTNSVTDETWPFAARNSDGTIRQAFYLNYLNNAGEGCGQYADGKTLSQYGSQACTVDSTGNVIGNKWNVILQKYYSGVQLATAQQLRTQHDFTYEQTSTEVAFNRGHWVINDRYPTSFYLGQAAGDLPVVTDNGDGYAHATIFRPSNGTWYIAGPTGAVTATIPYGIKGDVPVPGHYNGLTAPSALAVFRPSNGTWYVRGKTPVVLGQTPGDIPVPGAYSGNGTTDIAIFRPSNGTWYIAGQAPIAWGAKGDTPVPADYNGDGVTEVAVYRPATSTWYIPGRAPLTFGVKGDLPVTGDFNGDGKADIAVFRPSNDTWYVNGVGATVWGSAGTTPIGLAPYRG